MPADPGLRLLRVGADRITDGDPALPQRQGRHRARLRVGQGVRGSQRVPGREGRQGGALNACLPPVTRAELIHQGVLVDHGPVYELAQDYAFSSPSTVSGVLLGRSSNGRVERQTADGRSLKSVQDTDALG
ncbi:MAG: DUF4357 domain-containing protein [Candidatus Binatia bacterium]